MARGMWRPPDPVVRLLWALGDGAAWFWGVLFATWLRYQYDFERALTPNTWIVAGSAAAIHVAWGLVTGPYMVKHVRGSFEEVLAVARAVILTTAVLAVWAIWLQPYVVPRSVPAVGGALALWTMLGLRFVVRSYRARKAVRRNVDNNVIIYGAGVLGRRLVANMIDDDQASYRPVAFLDDDRSKRKLKIEGVPVRGGRESLLKVAKRYKATHLAIAMPKAEAKTLREIHDVASEAGLQVKLLETVDGFFLPDPSVSDLRDIDLADLLGRRQVQLDQVAIAEQLTGKVVLVTGAGGSIGSELSRQIARFSPSRLLLLDRDESALHATQLSITGRGLLEGENLLLADICDAEAIEELFGRHRPDVVFHAAALKHLPLLERYPHEAFRVNVQGTLNVLRASSRSGVGTFVNISTDKAANPTAVLGYTKRVTERLTSHYAYGQAGRYVSVRFGNVLGSRGSVVPSFTEQIRRGGPVTVTHPDVERYFMLIPEACELVMQAAAMGSDGDVLVLDMGEPVKIADMAQTLITLSGQRGIKIEFTGLRQGEKMSEDLFGLDEPEPTEHDLIQSVQVPALSPAELVTLDDAHAGSLVAWMRARSAPEESTFPKVGH